VKVKDNIFSSTSLGSVIIPNLEDGDLIIKIGFPQNNWNPLIYKLSLKNKDLAYILKKSKSNTWALYDYYSMSLIESIDTSSAFNNTFSTANDFAKLLSQVSGVNLGSNFDEEPKSENVTKDLTVSKPIEVTLPKKETKISSDKQPSSIVDTMLVMLVDSKKEDTLYPIVNSSDKDSTKQSSKKKDNLVKADTSINSIDSSSLNKNKSDSLLHETASLNVKFDSSLNKIYPQIDTFINEAKKEIKTDSVVNSYLNSKKNDSIFTKDKSALVSTTANDSIIDAVVVKSPPKKDLVFIENVAIQQAIVAPDSITVNKDFKTDDSISTPEKGDSIQDSLSKQMGSPKIKDSFDIKSNSHQIDLPSDTIKANLILDSMMSPNKTMQNESVSATKDTLIKKEVNLSEDTTTTKSNCKAIASDNDFIQLRRSMTKEDDESKMISKALVIFKEKCFTTSQIKNLAVLFLNDDAKFLFLETASLYVSDFEHLESLQSLLSDEKNINSFKKIINQTKAKE
jgi:hypothetical protein